MGKPRGFGSFQKRVAKNIRQARKNAGLTQENVIAKAGFNARWYQDIEAAKSDIRLSSVYRIARVLGIEPMELLE